MQENRRYLIILPGQVVLAEDKLFTTLDATTRKLY